MVWDAGDHESDAAAWPTLRLSDPISIHFTRTGNRILLWEDNRGALEGIVRAAIAHFLL